MNIILAINAALLFFFGVLSVALLFLSREEVKDGRPVSAEHSFRLSASTFAISMFLATALVGEIVYVVTTHLGV